MEIRTAEYWIENLKLQTHPEGGFYYESFVSKEFVDGEALPVRFGASRKHYTSIYFLLKSGQKSLFHRIKSDEIWNFHDGDPLFIHVIELTGKYSILKLGLNTENQEFPQQMVPAGAWFSAGLIDNQGFSLVGCFVAPGFDFADFELAKRDYLLKTYPQHKKIIEQFTISDEKIE